MICTVEEAKTKWCSYMKLHHYEGGHYNYPINTKGTSSNCIADKCMSWSWTGSDHKCGFCGRE